MYKLILCIFLFSFVFKGGGWAWKGKNKCGAIVLDLCVGLHLFYFLKRWQIFDFWGRLILCRIVQMPLPITEKVFAKGGLNWTKSSIFNRTKQIAFSDC